MCKTVVLELTECEALTLHEIIAGAQYKIGSDETMVGVDVICDIEEQLAGEGQNFPTDNMGDMPIAEIRFGPDISAYDAVKLKACIEKYASELKPIKNR